MWLGNNITGQTLTGHFYSLNPLKQPLSILIAKFALATIVLLYGFFIIYEGVKGKSLIKSIGRVRTVTYIVVFFTPVFYKVTELSWQLVFSLAFFFPLAYYFVEILDRLLPDPESIRDEKTGLAKVQKVES